MKRSSHSLRALSVPLFAPTAAVLLLFAASTLWAQGPPFQTDDPVPVDLHHYEFYIFGSMDGTPAEIDSTGPAFEFNWGAIPRVQLHAIAPFGGIIPVEQSDLPPGGTGPTAFGFTDMETRRQDRVHQRIEVHSPDRHLYDVRNTDR